MDTIPLKFARRWTLLGFTQVPDEFLPFSNLIDIAELKPFLVILRKLFPLRITLIYWKCTQQVNNQLPELPQV
jgi:hypothetical protein